MVEMLANEAQDPTYIACQLGTVIPHGKLTWMYSMRLSSGGSLFAITLDAGKAFGARLRRTFRREFVMTTEAMETVLC